MKTYTILLMGTHEGKIEKVSCILREVGYHTVGATCVKEMREKLRNNHIDLIIAPRIFAGYPMEELLDGADTVSTPRIRILLSDSHEGTGMHPIINSNGMWWVITAPWEKKTLCANVHTALCYADLLTRHEALLETASVLAAKNLSFEGKLQKILTLCLTQIDAEKGSIMLRDGRGDLVVKAATNSTLIGNTRSINDEKSVSVWVMKHGQPLFVENAPGDSRFKPSGDAFYKSNNFLCVPIKDENDTVIGVFNVTDKRKGELLTKDDETTLSTFIGKIGLLIENAQLREEVEDERRRLTQKNEELLVVEKMKEDLVNMIIHDLKGPLGEVMANLDLLGYGTLEEHEREYLDTAIQGSDNLLRMIFNLLDVRRMEEGKLRLHIEEFKVTELISEIIAKHKTMLKQKAIEVRTLIDEHLSMWSADRLLMERVLSNLLMNALEYSPRGSAIGIRCCFECVDKQLRVEVADSGKGIPKEFHHKIFEKFSQVDHNYADRRHSTGLGLTFCKMAVEAHQGSIWVESEENKGSRFIFLLPSLKSDEEVQEKG